MATKRIQSGSPRIIFILQSSLYIPTKPIPHLNPTTSYTSLKHVSALSLALSAPSLNTSSTYPSSALNLSLSVLIGASPSATTSVSLSLNTLLLCTSPSSRSTASTSMPRMAA
ncbi:hypothetical protein BC936DRAFT_149002 [Jimgerdemannia flammicorona]|uniref:Uncharacterized protein n=2 Tax=Jimgerdemannia flammicorona TaxID=994334 RepID=A0A433D1T7_9FUNG|nr:hypothetical protein BC936DRAFT_149002 [Jimgerdemannia flammicorona]RUS29875.1 hypothetical protein BC938DRAFT_480121 [Jimgerdemannia flammicorona]